MIGSSVVEVEVDGETKYKVVFELEATEETVEAAQEEEEITRINNSLVLPVSSTQTTTTRIESSVFIPVSSTGSADGVVQALIDAIEDQGIDVESFTFDTETGELSYVVKIVNYAGSGSSSLENTIEGALEEEGIEKDDVTHAKENMVENIPYISVTLDTFQLSSGWLKEYGKYVALENIHCISLTLDTSQLLMSPYFVTTRSFLAPPFR